jgi:endonuclease-3
LHFPVRIPQKNLMSAPKIKASERQAILARLVTVLKKRYGKTAPEDGRPIFETLLLSALLEESTTAQAERAYTALLRSFHDLNEIRVSSITEIEQALKGISKPDWRALRIRDALQTVFEAHYRFDLEHLKRKTHEQALKELATLRYSTPFMRTFVVQHCLGGHLLPIDESSLEALKWLGLVEPNTGLEAAAEELKTSVRKSDATVLCNLLRELANDPAFEGSFRLSAGDRKTGVDPHEAVERLNSLIASGGRKKAAAGKSAVSKTHRKPAGKRDVKRPRQGEKPKSAKAVTKKVAKRPAAAKSKSR